MKHLNFYNLQQSKYESCFRLQEKIHQAVCDKRLSNATIITHHFATITLGKNSDTSHLLITDKKREQLQIDLIQSNRGGQITGHTPGQIVIYPILPIYELQLDVRKYVFLLEEAIIISLKKYNISPKRRKNYPGVWIENRKICAIGIRVKKRVSMHGIALNVNNNLDIFNYMVPCGISSCQVTSLKNEINETIDKESLIKDITLQLQKLLKVSSATLYNEDNLMKILDRKSAYEGLSL